MIQYFLSFLKEKKIPYKITHGYESIHEGLEAHGDYDILLKVSDFKNLSKVISEFCSSFNFLIVQLYYQEVNSKNYFVYNPSTNEILNLDIYGELSINYKTLFTEDEIFSYHREFNGISILEPHQEFINYLIKKIYKGVLSLIVFNYLRELFLKEKELCEYNLKLKFKKNGPLIKASFINNNYSLIKENLETFKFEFDSLKKESSPYTLPNFLRIMHRIQKPTGFTICLLGPDGCGKSTIYEYLKKERLPFRRKDYFHLKPIKIKDISKKKIVVNPHQYKPYNKIKSYMKLLYFMALYNIGWIKNIMPLKIKSSLVIFDRYFDDILVDNRRYRYGGSKGMTKFVKQFVSRPDLYFILIADPNVIHKRKQEVPYEELKRQIIGYKSIIDNKKYIGIDVNKSPDFIVEEIKNHLMKRLNERF